MFFFRENSQISLHMDAEERRKSLANNPSICLTNLEESSPAKDSGIQDDNKKSTSDPFLTKEETDIKVSDTVKRNSLPSLNPLREAIPEETGSPSLSRIDVESGSEVMLVSKHQESSQSDNSPQLTEKVPLNSGANARPSPEPHEVSSGISSSSKSPLVQKQSQTTRQPSSKINFLSGMAKTFNRWRTKTKKKRKFNYEKYITYLESILPTVGFSLGGVIITYNGIYTFIVVITFLVGVFAQEAFFGN